MTSEIKQRIEQIRRGEVPERYVKTALGLAPTDWKRYTFGDIYTERKEPGDENLPLLMVSIHSGVSDGEVDAAELPKQVKRIEDKSQYKKAVSGDLVFNMMRAWQGAIGTVRTTGMVSPAYIVAEPNDKAYPLFMDYYSRTPQMINQIDRQSYGVTDFRKRLYWDSFAPISCTLPPIEEQQKIAAILTTQDKVIELKEKRLAEKQRQKKYLMQQLLTGKKRLPGFSGEWKNIKLCEVLSERKEKNVEQNLRICSVAVQKGVIDQIEHLGRSYAASDTSNYSVAHYGDIIYTKSPTGDFLYGIVKQNLLQETVAVSPLYGVFTPMTFGLGYFLHTYFQSAICAQNYLLPIVQKGAKNTINITNDTFISSKLYLPLDVEEQKAIADTFIAADREINLLRQDIEQEKQKKKALMQLLLTGIVRVKT
jgi:type I restriction enzyme S subunit